MKKTKIIAVLIVIFMTSLLQGQLSVNLNIGSPPQWGPAGYSDVHYYYLPDVEAYYDVQASRFIYYDGHSWVRRTYLPNRYRNYDLYNGYKVVMTDYRGNQPYRYYKQHKIKYAKGYRGHEQKNIGARPIRENSQVQQRSKNERNDRDKNRNQYKENKKDKGHGQDKKNGKGHGRGED